MKKNLYGRKIGCFSVCLTLAISLMAGCGDGGNTNTSTSATTTVSDATNQDAEMTKTSSSGEGEKRKLTMWNWSLGNYEKAIEDFFTIHDVDYEFEDVTVAAEDYTTKLQQGYASGGDMPDILLGEIGTRAISFQMGIWENLEAEPYNLDRSLLMDFAVGTCLDPDGNVVGLENGSNPSVIAYKKDMMKEYLGTDDKDELEAMFQTEEDYITIGQQVYEESGGTITMFAGPLDVVNMKLQQQRHISNLNDAGEIDVSAKIRPIMDLLVTMREANTYGNLMMWSSQWAANIGESSSLLFPTPPWGITAFINTNDPEGIDNWGMFPPAGGTFGWGGTSYGIYSGSDMKEEAWEFLSWIFYSKEGAYSVKDHVGVFLPIKSLYEDPEYTDRTHPLFGEEKIYKFMMEELAPELPMAKLTIYDDMITDSMNMIAEVIMMDESVTAEIAYERFIEDLKLKVPDVTVIE